MKVSIFLLAVQLFVHFPSWGGVLHVGQGYAYAQISTAAAIAQPGDTILCHDAVISGGMYISQLTGTAGKWIYIIAHEANVILQGGTNSIQLSDCAFLHIEGFTIRQQTGNGMNIDDGGSFESPSHHIRIVNCIFRDIQATGNNDLLKLSGIDYFEIRDCQFLNGAAGGSGIDMVGCHHGMIWQNEFINPGSNAIQAKGGSHDVQILRNRFENGGSRALNLGGSTGLAFFRPQNANTEAENIQVSANLFLGAEAPIAFVGCRNVTVSNNTILYPRKWVIRILQETVDPTRFLPCGDNVFFNNIIVLDNAVNTEVNIGPNTAPSTFMFSHNLWFKSTNASWNGPVLPGTVNDQIVKDPMFTSGSEILLDNNSPAIGAGKSYNFPVMDYFGSLFNQPPTIGAYEARPFINASTDLTENMEVYPNPFEDFLYCSFGNSKMRELKLFDMYGRVVNSIESEDAHVTMHCEGLLQGIYFLRIQSDGKNRTTTMIKK